MSSMRNVVQRRNYRERAQPKERGKWGILEKHKDYRLRAADYNAKKAHIKALRRKAADRNPDEFHFGMMSTKMSKDGYKLGDRGNKTLTQDTVRLLKTQDAGYLKTVAQKAKKETEALEHMFFLGDQQGTPKLYQSRGARERGMRTVFVETREEQTAYDLEHPGRGTLDAKSAQPGIPEVDHIGGAELGEDQRVPRLRNRRISKALERQKAKLEASRARQRQIEAAERELELQRAKMAKTPSVGGVNKWGVKWRIQQRKK